LEILDVNQVCVNILLCNLGIFHTKSDRIYYSVLHWLSKERHWLAAE